MKMILIDENKFSLYGPDYLSNYRYDMTKNIDYFLGVSKVAGISWSGSLSVFRTILLAIMNDMQYFYSYIRRICLKFGRFLLKNYCRRGLANNMAL